MTFGSREPEDITTLWRYMSFAKFCSLLERRALFFSLVGDMEDRYEGFIYPPAPREPSDHLQQAEQDSHDYLRKIARAALVSCWTDSRYESHLMWTAGGRSGSPYHLPRFARVDALRCRTASHVRTGQIRRLPPSEVSRFGSPLFHKRRSENVVSSYLVRQWIGTLLDVTLDPDVAELRGRYIPVNLGILVKEVVVPSHAAPWFAEVVKSAVQRSSVTASVTQSAI